MEAASAPTQGGAGAGAGAGVPAATAAAAAASGAVGKSAEMLNLEQLERDVFTRLRETERRIFADEAEYFSLSVTRADTAPAFGNLLSGWEGLLEGKGSDRRRGQERIYSGA